VEVVPGFKDCTLSIVFTSAIDDIFWDVKEDIAMPQLERVGATPLEESLTREDIYLLEAAIFDIAIFRTIVRRQINSFEVVDAIQQSLALSGRLHFVGIGKPQASRLSKRLYSRVVAVVKDMISTVDMVKVCPSCFTPA
jgi:hypothetical protein